MEFNSILNYLMDLMRDLGPLGVFISVLVESIIAPIPSPLVIMAAGFLILPAGASFAEILLPLIFVITLPGAIGSTIGAFIGYGIGYLGGKPLIKKFEWLLGISWDELEGGLQYFQKGMKDELIIFFMRAIPIMPLVIFSGVAGVARIKVDKFALFTFLGMIVRVFILGLVGWLMGSAYVEIAQKLDQYEIIGYVITFALVAGIMYYLYKIRKKSKKVTDKSSRKKE